MVVVVVVLVVAHGRAGDSLSSTILPFYLDSCPVGMEMDPSAAPMGFTTPTTRSMGQNGTGE